MSLCLLLHQSPALGICPEQVTSLLLGLVTRQIALMEDITEHLRRLFVGIEVSYFIPTARGRVLCVQLMAVKKGISES